MSEEAPPLGPEDLAKIVQTKATCPFVGAAVATGKLQVRNEATNPLASIEDVRRLGNSGGGDLENVLAVFATGNHGRMRGSNNKLNLETPDGMFSLDFPGSKGSHPGHSGILEGTPEKLDTGRFSPEDFQRLAILAVNGLIKLSDVGKFIAGNLHRDPGSKVFGASVVELLGHDLEGFVAIVGPHLLDKLRGIHDEGLHQELDERLTKLLGEDNLVGSAGEYGLLFAFFANRKGAETLDGEPALPLEDVQSMFVDKRLPGGMGNLAENPSGLGNQHYRAHGQRREGVSGPSELGAIAPRNLRRFSIRTAF
jgi:hypothetical protein